MNDDAEKDYIIQYFIVLVSINLQKHMHHLGLPVWRGSQRSSASATPGESQDSRGGAGREGGNITYIYIYTYPPYSDLNVSGKGDIYMLLFEWV